MGGTQLSPQLFFPALCPATFTVNWSGSDDAGGSGIATYDVFVSENGGPFHIWLVGTTDTQAMFEGMPDETYAFYSIARDNLGHEETPPATADSATTVRVAAWQNRDNPRDVNNDTFVTPTGDVLPLINELNRHQIIDNAGRLPLPAPADLRYYYDQNGDGLLTPVGDVLPIINFINLQGSGEAEGLPGFPFAVMPPSVSSRSEPNPRQFSESRSVDETAPNDERLLIPKAQGLAHRAFFENFGTRLQRPSDHDDLIEVIDESLVDQLTLELRSRNVAPWV